MNRPSRRAAAWTAFGLGLALAACGTTAPTRYLTLAAAPSFAAGRSGAGLVLRPPEVRWPAAFDRMEVARPTAGVEVTVEEFTRWSAAPGRLAAAALTADLLARLPGATVAPWTDSATDTAVVSVQIEDLIERPAGYGMLATVSLARGSAPLERWTFTGEADGAHNATGQSQAMSRLLGDLADRIAVDLTAGLSAPASAAISSPRPRP